MKIKMKNINKDGSTVFTEEDHLIQGGSNDALLVEVPQLVPLRSMRVIHEDLRVLRRIRSFNVNNLAVHTAHDLEQPPTGEKTRNNYTV